MSMKNELALFAGSGGGLLGGKLLGWRTVCAVEIDKFCREVLLKRQMDGCLHKFPIWDDIKTFDGRPWCGKIDIVTGGFPCQDVSSMGKGRGIKGERSGLWFEMARVIGEVRPRYALVENSPMLVSRGLESVLGSLAELGYDARWGIISARDAGFEHERKRLWILAYDDNMGWKSIMEHGRSIQMVGKDESSCCKREGLEFVIKSSVCSFNAGRVAQESINRYMECKNTERIRQWKEIEPGLVRVVDGVARGMDKRIYSVGNGQVPSVVALAWRILSVGLEQE